MIEDLFAQDDSLPRQWQEQVAPGAVILRGYATDDAEALLRNITEVAAAAPFRHLVTPGGHRMSVAMTNCGPLGWISDERGYRYSASDPLSGQPWPEMPGRLRRLAELAAATAGYPHFLPDACLINRYTPGARMTLHQDKDERDLAQPVVSLSLGLSANFLFGGLNRASPCLRFPLIHGDIMVWGGASRLNYHGVLPLKSGLPPWPVTESVRYNLTFRRVMSE